MIQENQAETIKAIIVHPCEIIRHCITALLEKHGYEVTLIVDSCEALARQLVNQTAEVILIHYSQCTSRGLITQFIDKTGAGIALLASSDSYHHDTYKDMMERVAEGATGFLDMDEPVNTFLSELQDIASGDVVISKKFVKNLSKKTGKVDENLEEALSKREMEILELVAEGDTNKEIGEELFLSEHTVKVHLTNILSKLNLKNRQQAVAYIIRKRMMMESVREEGSPA